MALHCIFLFKDMKQVSFAAAASIRSEVWRFIATAGYMVLHSLGFMFFVGFPMVLVASLVTWKSDINSKSN